LLTLLQRLSQSLFWRHTQTHTHTHKISSITTCNCKLGLSNFHGRIATLRTTNPPHLGTIAPPSKKGVSTKYPPKIGAKFSCPAIFDPLNKFSPSIHAPNAFSPHHMDKQLGFTIPPIVPPDDGWWHIKLLSLYKTTNGTKTWPP
jgi:hypothetical protein